MKRNIIIIISIALTAIISGLTVVELAQTHKEKKAIMYVIHRHLHAYVNSETEEEMNTWAQKPYVIRIQNGSALVGWDEIKRAIAALQTTKKHADVYTPANWNPGDEILIPYLTGEHKEQIQQGNSDIRQDAWFLNYRKLD